ncbi:hypothetical protein IMSAG049_00284 [Clostridiales bacterium]|nr:hypothetical protein IMSAG049_00284 [Clostridiales bacterium]
MEKRYEHITRTFGPIYDNFSEILILGSFPSVKSREVNFFYGHPQNRFWKVISAVYGCPVPESIEEKKEFLLHNHIALWDTIDSCDIIGSSDSTIKNVIPTDINIILRAAKIKAVFCNGAASHRLYMKYCYPATGVEAIKLPSTSPANAAFSLEKLILIWTEEINKAI